jgi:hypothetical protein
MITKLAIAWLNRRGFSVVARHWRGLMIGRCEAIRVDSDASFLYFRVAVPRGSMYVAKNHASMVMRDPHTGNGGLADFPLDDDLDGSYFGSSEPGFIQTDYGLEHTT